MESNVKVIDESHLGETNGAKDEVSELPVDEKVVTVESTGDDEVFDKDVVVEMSGGDLEDRYAAVVDEGGSNGENVGICGGSLPFEEGSQSIEEEDGDEKFEEAVEAAVEDERFEEAVYATPRAPGVDDEIRRKLGVLGNEGSEVQDQNASNHFTRDETEQLDKIDSVESSITEVMEVTDLDAARKIDASAFADQVNEKSNEVVEEPENGVLDHLNPGETTCEAAKNTNGDDNDAVTVDDGIHDVGVHEELVKGDGNEVKGGLGNPLIQGQSYKDVLLRSEKSIEVRGTSGATDTGLQDEADNQYCNSVIPTSELKGKKCPDLDEKDSSLLESVKSDCKIEDAPPSDTSVNGHHGENLFFNEEQKDVHSIDDGVPKEKGIPVPAAEQHGDGSVGHRETTLGVVSSNSLKDTNQGNKYEGQKDVQSNDRALDQHGRSLKLPLEPKEKEKPVSATKNSGDISVGCKAITPEDGNSHSLKNSIDNNVETCASSSNLVVERSKYSQPQHVNDTPDIARTDAKEPDNKAISSTRTRAPALPAGLGRAAPLLQPATRVVQQPRVNGAVPPVQRQLIGEPTNAEGEEYDETCEKLQMIRVKFLRLAHRLGQTTHNVVVAQVLYRLGLAEQLRGSNGGRVAAFSFDRASAMAEQLEAAGQEPLDFSCTILVLGKTGVGKSATINSIFDEGKFSTDAFHNGTKKVQDVVGTVQGIRVRVIDTPGLLSSGSDQCRNVKMLQSVKRFIKKTPPDIVLYLDRLDMQSRDYGDMPLLRTITEIFGPSIWFNAIVVLTHAASAPPEGPNGTATSYDMFVTQRTHVVQQAIRQAAGDMRLMNPVSLVENHSACRTNPAGQRVLPNGQVWKPHLLLLSFASKILAEANTLLKLQDGPPGRTFAPRSRSPPLPFLLTSLLQSRQQVKLPTDQFGEDDETLDDDLDDSSDSEEESEYDQLPPFKCLTKEQLAKLSKEQRKAYYDELEYREKLLMKKQLKEERRRRKALKKMRAAAKDLPTHSNENAGEDIDGAASVPVPMPDLTLPASFDSDNPTYRYRCLDSSNQWLVRPVQDSQGWDHDVGYDGINVERLFVVKEKIPLSFSGQVTKDKKDSTLQMEMASSVNYGDGKATSLGFEMQSLGKDIVYTLRSETKFMNFRRNKATAGLSATILGDSVTGGFKVEDKLFVGKRGQIVMTGGAMYGRGDVAYGGSLEATLRDKEHPLGRFLSVLGLSVMDWHGDLAIGCNSQTQIPVGRHTNLIGRVNINNKGSGQISLRLTSSEQLQIALVCLVPLVKKILGFSQQNQFN